jgi:hypothetical protein
MSLGLFRIVGTPEKWIAGNPRRRRHTPWLRVVLDLDASTVHFPCQGVRRDQRRRPIVPAGKNVGGQHGPHAPFTQARVPSQVT